MKSHRREIKKLLPSLPNWTPTSAERAAPYLTTILQSLRDSWLERQGLHRRAERLDALPGRSDRHRLVALAELARGEDEARQRIEEALDELASLGAECPDPNRGLALLPFVHRRMLAWFVVDLHEGGTLQWRFHTDLADRRRWLTELQG